MGGGESQAKAENLLRRAGAILEGHFQLSSGRHSGLYVEKFRLLERPDETGSLCRMIADWAEHLSPGVIAGPTTGGIIISYEVARHLGLRSIFAESVEEGGRVFGRGFTIGMGERVIVVDDVLTTGGSVRDVINAVKAAGGEVAGVAVLIDRSGGRTDFGAPFFSCLALDLPTYEPGEECPHCSRDEPLTLT